MVDEELEKSKLEADTEKTEIQVKITVFIVSSNSDVFLQFFFLVQMLSLKILTM